MKKIQALIICSLLLSLNACKKKEKGNIDDSYEARLVGVWTLKSVDYESEVELEPGKPIQIEGSGKQVTGTLALTRSPNTFDLTFSFLAAVDLGGGVPIPIPIDEAIKGTWTATADGKHFVVTDDQTQVTSFDVVTNEVNRQVFSGTMTQDVPIVGNIEVAVIMEFTK